MDTKEFVDFGKAAIDFVANYTDNLRNKNVLPDVEPGYLSELLPEEAPQKAETWQQVLKDVEQYIIPGVTHWNSPHFHAFYPTANSYPALVGEILSSGIGCIGFSWLASPACTELEVITMNWLGKLIGLPKEFLNCSEGPGGGVIQGSASETTLVCLLAAIEQTTRQIKHLHSDWDDAYIRSKLVTYTSDQSNSSVEKAGILASVAMKLLPADEKCVFRGETLLKAIKEDLVKGLIPCCVIATLGTTGTCAFDKLEELGPICKEYNVWLHVDAAYAGAAFVCPEYRYLMTGVEYADSFNINPHKWLLVNFDCSALWVKDSRRLIEAFSVDRIYLAHDKEGLAPDYRNWQIPLGRRFRSLKLWFVLRLYGVDGLQEHIRRTIKFAQRFEEYVKSDSRFELVIGRSMGLICFRMKGDNQLTKELLTRLTAEKKIYVVAATFREKLVVRFVICSRLTREDDVIFAWNEITKQATEIVGPKTPCLEEKAHKSFAKSSADLATRIESLNLESKTQTIS
ncbi:aromatic-L-amino-acid decarboxylase-like [Osmia bicornis bicornis]|uniref:aromatic-L-amino-acid decarboxylase-like n=1 Tax=Osmia bicornis bicornis TaxID=1437191 RepID=UPI0010F83A4A|nr:aromatic-L-amino-acid decarboxylase-like [Osmia bicornis bicornis]XP_029043288.1 aromatic-L-amino-acid decarboxylase-like [Osmia bicornis bicornis]